MMGNNITRITKNLQVSQDGDFSLQGIALKRFVWDLIIENAKHTVDGFSLYADNLSYAEKIIFLSHLCDASDYAYYMENSTRLVAAIGDYLDDMQSIIDANIDDVYQDAMSEMGMSTTRLSNGDVIKMRKYY